MSHNARNKLSSIIGFYDFIKMQNNNFRSATNLHSLGRSRSDNTFATATNLGNVLPSTTNVSFRASGTVSKSDKVDFYKLTLSPGANLPSGQESYRLKNGSAVVSTYGEAQGQRLAISKYTFRRGSNSFASSLVNPSQVPITIYLKVERRTEEARYNFTFNYFR
jgi:hypothetical protein